MWANKKILKCSICTASLENLWYLPKLPFTEKYGKYYADHQLFLDQALLFCPICGHVQLERQISPSILYAPSEYTFRTTNASSAKIGSKFFLEFLEKVADNKKFNVLLDIGGNDLYLANMFKQKVLECYVIDPVCQENDGKTIDGVKVIGKAIEQTDLYMKPDLIFCRHVLEHLAEPKELLQKLFLQCHDDALFLFEIPDFEQLVLACRWDAIFHQHYHYFDIDDFRYLLKQSGGEYLAHIYNQQGSCGGSLLIAFRKGKEKIKKQDGKMIMHKFSAYQQSIRDYMTFMDIFAQKVKTFKNNIYGYGASLMLATLAYHLKTDFKELLCILDDDEKKNGWEYQNIPVKICYTGKEKIPQQANFLITSLENCRLLYQKLLKYQPSRILMPYIS